MEYNGTAKPENTVHVWDSKYTTEEEATCTSEGKQSIRWLMCDAVKPGSERKIAKLPHTYRTTVVKAVMNRNGNIVNTCTGCKKIVNRTIDCRKSVSLSATTYTYNGKMKKPTVKIKTSTGKTLTSDNYSVSFEKGVKTSTIKKYKTTSKTISKLKSKKKYYVRVRTYKTVKINGKSTKLYSGWSKTKAVKVK